MEDLALSKAKVFQVLVFCWDEPSSEMSCPEGTCAWGGDFFGCADDLHQQTSQIQAAEDERVLAVLDSLGREG